MRTRLRTAFALTAAGTLVFAGAAAAAPAKKAAPVCNQVTDGKDDAEIVTSQPGMDIVSGDISSDAKQLTTVIRLAAAPNTANPEAVGASRYYFEFLAPGAENVQYLQASIAFGTGAATFRSGEIVPSANGSTFTNDPLNEGVTGKVEGDVITITAKLSALPRIKPAVGTKIKGLTVETYALAGVLLLPVDDAVGTKTYTAGAPTCVKPVS